MPRVDFDVVVHSVFQSAINLCPSRGAELLTLVTSSEADLPQGIRLDTPQNFSFEIFSVGERVTCRDDILRLDSLTADLHRARCWKCDLPALEADIKIPAVAYAWGFVWDALNKQQRLSDADIIADELFHPAETKPAGISHKAGEAMWNLINATRRYDLSDISAINSLIGLGFGLTPSGDDLLIGFLAGLWCTVRDKSERAQFISGLGRAIIHHSEQTNDISRTYLYHAAQGQVSSLLADLAEAICRGKDPDRLDKVAHPALRVGHTSGMDAVTGMLLGLTVWDDNLVCQGGTHLGILPDVSHNFGW